MSVSHIFEFLIGTLLFTFTFFTVHRYIFLISSLKKRKNKELKKVLTKFNKFIVLVPAHNEEILIGKTVDSLKSINYPKKYWDLIVIADNCNDNTARIVRDNQVKCIERGDEDNKGKGYAINWALQEIDLSPYDALLLLDADSLVSTQILAELNQDINEGRNIIQGNHGVIRRPNDWLVDLAYLSDIIQFKVHYQGRTNLNLPVKMIGSAMCFTMDIINKYGWKSFSLTEDFEQFLKYVMNNEIVYFNIDAVANSYQPPDLKNAKSQRLRWIKGEVDLILQYLPKLFIKGIFRLNWKKIDIVIESLLPSFSIHLFFIMSMLPIVMLFNKFYLFIWHLSIILLFIIYIMWGLKSSNIKVSVYTKTILLSPVYISWKMLVSLLSFSNTKKKWVRTTRSIH